MLDPTENGEDPRLAEALEEYLSPDESNGTENRAALLSKYADIAEELTACLDAVQVIHKLSPHLLESPLGQAGDSNVPYPMFDDYRVLREIGRGGMGVVYEAEQLSLGRPVALKVLPLLARMDQRRLARFKNEAHAAALLQHPHIVSVYAVGCYDGAHYYAMQFVNGWTLADIIVALRGTSCDTVDQDVVEPRLFRELARRRHTQPTRYYQFVAELGIAAADALEHAHEMGVIHRDIKPSNLLLDGQKHLWVTDFGLAQIEADQTLTLTGDQLGTLPYMSPEQALARRSVMDHRTDIYSLGATLYELLTLSRAFAADSREELLQKIERAEPILPRRINREIPEDLQTIVLKAMAKEPAERYQSAHELAEDLDRSLKNQPIYARRPTFANRLVKWSYRNRASVTVAVASLVVLLTVLAVGSSYFAVRINRVASEATSAQAKAEHSLSSFQIARGVQLMDEGRLHESLAWFAEPLQRGYLSDAEESQHQLRLASVMRHCPRIIRFWSHPAKTSGVPAVDRATVNHDGTLVATGHANGNARIWDVDTGDLVAQFQHGDEVKHIDFSPIDTRIVTASNDGTTQVWDAETGRALAPPLQHTHPVVHTEFSHDGSRVVTMTSQGVAQVWDASTGLKVGISVQHEPVSDQMFTSSTKRVSFSPDGERILTSFVRNTARVWDVASGEPITPYLLHDKIVSDARFSLDGSRVLVLTDDRAIHHWDAATGQLLERNSNSVQPGAVSAIGRIGPDLCQFAAVYHDGSAQVSETDSATKIARIASRNAFLWDLSFGPDGHRLVTVHFDGQVTLWDLAGHNTSDRSWRFGHPVYSGSCPIDGRAADGRTLVLTSDGATARLWDLTNGKKMVAEMRHDTAAGNSNREGIVTFGVVSSDGGRAITTSTDGTARLWSTSTGQLLHTFVHDGRVNYAALSPDGRRLATATHKPSNMGAFFVWDINSGELLHTSEFVNDISDLSFSADGQRLVVSIPGYSSGFFLWAAGSSNPPTLLKHGGRGQCAAFRPDSQHLVTGGSDRTARIWNYADGELVIGPLRHDDTVVDVAFSKTGELLATCSSDGAARVWDAETGFAITPPLKHGEDVRLVWFSQDSRYLYTAGTGGMVRRWNLSVDDWPRDALIQAAQLLGGHTLRTSGSLLPIGDEKIHSALDELRQELPEQFLLSRQDVAAWHERVADDCMDDQQWQAAAWHLDRFLRVDGRNGYAYRLRGKACEQTRQWERAAADYLHAIELGITDPELLKAHNWCRALSVSRPVVPPGSVWNWLHPIDGTDPAATDTDFHTTFFRTDFDDSIWQVGHDSIGTNGGFGYGNTVGIDIGKPGSGNRKTAYFRLAFETKSRYNNLILSLRRDDGVIIYLDGKEAARDNMTSDAEAYDLLAAGSAGDTEGELRHIALGSTLPAGQHVLAISLHNRSTWSSDLQIGEISLFGKQADQRIEE